MHPEVCSLHHFHRSGDFPVHLKPLLLSEKQITLYQVINLHETHRTNICYLKTAFPTNEGTQCPPHSGHRGPTTKARSLGDPLLPPGASSRQPEDHQQLDSVLG